VRKGATPSGRPFTLTDTVGFVRHLPHQLVDSFRSTLEEAADADLILHVVDGSDADPQAQLSAVRGVLAEVGARNVPELVVINKIDDADPVALKALQLRERDSIGVSARTGEGIEGLRAAIEERLPERDRLVRVSVPYSRGDLVSRVHAAGEVTRAEHGPDGTVLEARVPPGLAAELEQYAVA
jgi:GTPase